MHQVHFVIRYTVFVLIFALSLTFIYPIGVSAAESNTGTSETSEQSNLDKWMDICTTMGKNLTKNHFRYSKVHTGRSYKESVKRYRRSNCASYVSWCLQEYGILKKGEMVFARGSGKPNKNFSSWKGKVKLIRTYKKPARAHLQPGDVVLWKGIVHINIYAGRNSKGQMIWLDGGSAGTRRGRVRYYNSADKMKVFNYLNKHTVSYIIRIKDL